MEDAPSQNAPSLLERDYRETLNRTAEYFERYIALVILVLGFASLVNLWIGKLIGAQVPTGIPTVLVVFGSWYGGVYLLLRKGWWGSPGRWASTVFDTLLPTSIFILDFVYMGPAFAMSAAGPPLYPITILLAVLRLDWRLCLLAGVLTSAQHALVVVFLIRPALPPELYSVTGVEDFMIVSKTIPFFAAGIFGMLASRALQRLFLRVTANTFERNRVRSLFGMHVSESVMRAILDGSTREEGERRTVTVCFTDIRDFTSLSEPRPPEEIVALLNRYFARMCDVVAKHGGVVNKFMGDGMLIIFGAPNALERDAENAYAAALEMLEAARAMRESDEFPDLRIGIGLHRGEVVAATLGGKQRQEYTVIGDVVNSASRIQSLTRELKRPLLLTGEVRACLPQAQLESLGPAKVKGKQLSLELYAPREQALETPAPVRSAG